MRKITLDTATGKLVSSTESQLFGQLKVNTYSIDVPSDVWNIQHDLNTTRIFVSASDGSGAIFPPEAVTIVDSNNITITPLVPQSVGNVNIIW